MKAKASRIADCIGVLGEMAEDFSKVPCRDGNTASIALTMIVSQAILADVAARLMLGEELFDALDHASTGNERIAKVAQKTICKDL